MASANLNIGTLTPEWLDKSSSYEPAKIVFQYRLLTDGQQVDGVESGHLQKGDTVTCMIENNELMLNSVKVAGSRSVPIDALGLSEKDQANLLGQALFQFAKNGYDPDSNVRASACHIVDDTTHAQKDGRPTKRIFIAANANHRARSQRFDAEAVALGVAKNVIGVGNFMVKETYLTLDQPKAPGEIMTPCGTCREELTNKAYIDKDAMLYCIPFEEPMPYIDGDGASDTPHHMDNSGMEIDDQSQTDVPNPADTPKGHIFKQKTMDLVPYKNVDFPREVNGRSMVDIMNEGRAWATNGANELDDFNALPVDAKALEQLHKTGRSSELPYLNGEDGQVDIEKVNMFLSNKIKAAYNNLTSRTNGSAIEPEDIRKIRASVVRLQTGECYASMYIDGEGLGAKPLGEMSALSNAFNPTNVNEVYVMEYNPVYMDERMDERGPNARAVYPEALDRIYKSTKHSFGEWTRRTQDGGEEMVPSKCMIHQIPLNNGALSKEALEQSTQKLAIQELYPGPYKAANSMAASCC